MTCAMSARGTAGISWGWRDRLDTSGRWLQGHLDLAGVSKPHQFLHGYGAIDFTLLDQRLVPWKDFRAMVTQGHSLGLYVIVDVVVNHLRSLLL